MNQLVQVRKNILYAKDESKDADVEYIPIHELVFVVSSPSYSLSNEQSIIRSKKIEEFRFVLSTDEMYDELIEDLKSLKNAKLK